MLRTQSALSEMELFMRYLKNQVIQGTLILTIAGFVTRLIGFVYRVYLSDMIGARLLGVYQLIFPVYGICFTIYASGIQTAISQKIASISETVMPATKEPSRDRHLPLKEDHTISPNHIRTKKDLSLDSNPYPITRHEKELSYFKTGLTASLLLAFTLSFFVFLFARQIASYLLLEKSCTVYLKILCLLFPFCGISACINGYFYGKKEAKYPAVSQIVEQLSRVFIVVLLCTFLPYSSLIKSYFAVCGLVFGEFMASVYNIIRFALAQKDFFKNHIAGSNRKYNSISSLPEKNSLHLSPGRKSNTFFPTFSLFAKQIAGKKASIKNSLLFLAITLTGTKLIISLLHSAESVFIPAALRKYGYSASHALSTYGILSGVALPFILFPSAITNSFAVMLLPSIAQASAQKKRETIQKYVSLSGKYSLYLGYFFTCIFLLLGQDFGIVLFQSKEAGLYITWLSFICPALYLSTTFTSIINGLGATQITFFITIISLGINIASLVFFVPAYGMKAYLAGSILSDYLMVLLECIYLHSYIQIDFCKTFLLPVLFLLMSLLVFPLLSSFLPENLSHMRYLVLLFLKALIIAVCYLGFLITSGCMTITKAKKKGIYSHS